MAGEPRHHPHQIRMSFVLHRFSAKAFSKPQDSRLSLFHVVFGVALVTGLESTTRRQPAFYPRLLVHVMLRDLRSSPSATRHKTLDPADPTSSPRTSISDRLTCLGYTSDLAACGTLEELGFVSMVSCLRS